jgi:hypothetical protein
MKPTAPEIHKDVRLAEGESPQRPRFRGDFACRSCGRATALQKPWCLACLEKSPYAARVMAWANRLGCGRKAESEPT